MMTIKTNIRLWYLMLALALCSGIATAQEPPKIAIPTTEVGSPQRPIRLDDIVELREVQEAQISPDGTTIAFIVRQAFVALNAERSALYVVATVAGSVPVQLIEEPALSSVAWAPDGTFLTYLSSKSGSQQIWQIEPKNNAIPKPLFEHKPAKRDYLVDSYIPTEEIPSAGVFQYEWSPKGHTIAFTALTATDSIAQKQLDDKGVVYDDAKHGASTLLTKSWVKNPTELWTYDIAQKTEQKIWQVDEAIADFQWAPDSKTIALSYAAPPVSKESNIYFNQDIGIINIGNGQFSSLASGEAHEASVSWSPDGRFLAFGASLDEKSSLRVMNLSTKEVQEYGRRKFRQITKIFWSKDQSNLFVESGALGLNREGTNTLYSFSLSDGAYKQVANSSDRLSGFSINSARSVLAAVRENPTMPPDVAVLYLDQQTLRTVTTLNPEYESVLLGEVTKMRWRNAYDAETTGFLIKPLDYQQGKRYPLLMIHYGFGGSFISDAEWMTNYPAQLFSAKGYMVLLMNAPRHAGWKGNNFEQGSISEGYSPLSSMEKIVEILDQQGLIDPSKMGVMGLSYGCFLAQFAIAHSSLFKVASVANGGDWNPGIYWLAGNRKLRKYYDRVMGGGPYDATLKNWMAFSPAFNAHKIKSPVLMQFNPNEALLGLEFFTALRTHKIPTELVIYPKEGHIFTQPIHRINAMKANLDWFDFWLQNKKDPHPEKKEQYKRWDELKQTHQRLLKRQE